MKRIMQRSYFILIVALAFFVGIGFTAYKIVANSSTWVQSDQNPHLPSNENLAEAGDILDRNGVVLAHTDDNEKRVYHEDESVRRALLHVVGDNSTNISTSIQSMFRADLSGYNYVLGMGLPESLKGNSDLHLTVDAMACKAAYEAMKGKNGACIVYNYKTGEVLVSVSNPSYDPANPPEITEENIAEYDGVYLDNVLSSTYIPGSTFKIITAAAAIENIPDIYQRTFTCTGTHQDYEKITCEHAHGELTFEQAIAHSCNCAVAEIAIEIGDEKLKETAEKLGFNYKGYTLSGIPLAASSYDAVGKGEIDLAWSGIGQFTDLANPAHMAMICAAIANGGTAVSPYLIEEDGTLLGRLGIMNKKAGNVNMLSAETAGKLKTIMHAAADHYDLTIGGMTSFCAKTGTADIDADADGNQKTNAWFVGFIDDERYPYAFAVVREVVKDDDYAAEDSYGKASAAVIDAAISELMKHQ